MEPEEPFSESVEDVRPEETPERPLVKGRPLSREESVERMYARFDKTFEALAK